MAQPIRVRLTGFDSIIPFTTVKQQAVSAFVDGHCADIGLSADANWDIKVDGSDVPIVIFQANGAIMMSIPAEHFDLDIRMLARVLGAYFEEILII